MKKQQQNAVVRPRSGQRNLFHYKLLDWIFTALIGIAVAATLLFGIFTPRIVEKNEVRGIEKGDLVFLDRFSKYLFGLDRGDAVLLRAKKFQKAQAADNEQEDMPGFVRVIAFSGERVTVADGNVYIDDTLLDESEYARDLFEGIRADFTVPEGSVFVLPDDRFGITGEMIEELIVSLGGIKGEVRFNAYPFTRLRVFK